MHLSDHKPDNFVICYKKSKKKKKVLKVLKVIDLGSPSLFDVNNATVHTPLYYNSPFLNKDKKYNFVS